MPFQRIPRVSDLLPGAIKGLWTIGDVTSWHVEIGTNDAGDSGIRLYGSDGATKLIDLNVVGQPSITGALIRTAASGQRVELDGNAAHVVKLYSGDPSEQAPADLTTAAAGSVRLHTPDVGHGQGWLEVGTPGAGTWPAYAAVYDQNGNLMPFLADQVADANQHHLVKFVGTTDPHKINADGGSFTLDANGEVDIFHGLGASPIFASVVTGTAAAAYLVEVGSITSTKFTARVFVANTGARAAGVTLTMRWWAIAVG